MAPLSDVDTLDYERELNAEDLAALGILLDESVLDVQAIEDRVRSLLGALGMWDDPLDRTVAELGDVVGIARQLLSIREEILGSAPQEWVRTWLSTITG